jgi:hypothetical protein
MAPNTVAAWLSSNWTITKNSASEIPPLHLGKTTIALAKLGYAWRGIAYVSCTFLKHIPFSQERNLYVGRTSYGIREPGRGRVATWRWQDFGAAAGRLGHG